MIQIYHISQDGRGSKVSGYRTLCGRSMDSCLWCDVWIDCGAYLTSCTRVFSGFSSEVTLYKALVCTINSQEVISMLVWVMIWCSLVDGYQWLSGTYFISRVLVKVDLWKWLVIYKGTAKCATEDRHSQSWKRKHKTVCRWSSGNPWP
jgi:hypothetical protein